MTELEFNEKYKDHIEDKFYGLEFDYPSVTEYLDRVFAEEIEANSNFQFAQVKLKFGTARVYSNSKRNHEFEIEIDRLVAIDEAI